MYIEKKITRVNKYGVSDDLIIFISVTTDAEEDKRKERRYRRRGKRNM